MSIWTSSFVVYNGKRMNLEDSYLSLKRKMNDEKYTIEVTKVTLVFGEKITLKKNLISSYGEAGL